MSNHGKHIGRQTELGTVYAYTKGLSCPYEVLCRCGNAFRASTEFAREGSLACGICFRAMQSENGKMASTAGSNINS